ncbi:unnamed protein product [Schistosoma margrebowiei]|uniref:Uncharacterized protein n=1 Tax=Schistosoma margrebowiei TaxID=48269 RepID=A0A183M294_9TREM|nr:unnamed protein product [Schistosoma margrebowiei]
MKTSTSEGSMECSEQLDAAERQNFPIQHNMRQSNPSCWKIFGGCKTFTYLDNITDARGGPGSEVKARIGKARAAYLQVKNICNSKQLSTNTGQHFQYKCQDSSTVWNGNLDNYESHHSEDTSV